MNGPINLMSLRARRQECWRMRLRQWTKALLVLTGFLVAVTAVQYAAYLGTYAEQQVLEAKYEPVNELKNANKLLTRQIAAIRGEEQFVLALSEREPTLTLLGLLGDKVLDSKERVFVQKIELRNLVSAGGVQEPAQTSLDVAGLANSSTAVTQFADALKSELPFGKIDITSTKEVRMKQQTMNDFNLQGTF
jgi:cell division protein FtsB